MEINYYRKSTALGSDESWKNCQFTPATNLSDFTIKTLITINGQPILRTHHTTYLTGKETCHAHHFAKHLAIQVLNATPTTVPSTPVPCAVALPLLSSPPIQLPTPLSPVPNSPSPVPRAVTLSRPHHPVAPATPPSQSPSDPVPVCSNIVLCAVALPLPPARPVRPVRPASLVHLVTLVLLVTPSFPPRAATAARAIPLTLL